MGKVTSKILYALIIIVSGFVLLVSTAEIIVVWTYHNQTIHFAMSVLDVVETASTNLRTVVQQADQKLEQLQTITTQISTGAAKISQNVTDQGLIRLVLPDTADQKLAEVATTMKQTFASLHDSLTAGMALYNSIKQIPFVTIPAPVQEQVDNLSASLTQVQTLVEGLQQDIAAFRAGASDRITKIQTAADQITARIVQTRSQLADLDAILASALSTVDGLKQSIPPIITTLSIALTLILAWIVYCQIVVLLLFRKRWFALTAGESISELPGSSVIEQDAPVVEPDAPPPDKQA